MSDTITRDAYGAVIEPATFKIERLLPGPIERVWDHLTKSELRRKWLAAGEMTLVPDAPFEFVWRNEELHGSVGARPEGMPEEHRLESRILDVEPPRRLAFAWKEGDVTFTLDPVGDKVKLTVVHRRVSDRSNLTAVSAGWHAHLDVLVALLNDERPTSFWDAWQRLRAQYDARIPE